MKIYTKTGDAGATGLLGGRRVAKDAARIEAYGTVDELNAVLGLCRSEPGADPELGRVLGRVQEELFALGAALASEPGRASRPGEGVGGREIESLEREIDAWEDELPSLSSFILPGGERLASLLHLARTVCRRAERRTVALAAAEAVPPDAVAYLNRLSDHLFVAARIANRRAGQVDVPWRPRREGG